MSAIARPILATDAGISRLDAAAPDALWRRVRRSGRISIGGGILLAMVLACLLSLPLTLNKNSVLFRSGFGPKTVGAVSD